jgi:NADPH-dependent 2,4-dienoyl-CoA reductase/sulfur reductase-like enzyme
MVEAFAAGKLEVTLIEAAPSFPPGIEGELYTLVSSELMSKSIRVITRQAVAEIRDAGGVKNVILSGGEVLKADLVLVAAGVVPNAELAASAGLATGVKGAVSIDRHGLTSDPGIYAAGDCAEVYHRVLGGNTWIPLALSANRLGRVVGENVAGMASVFPGVVGTAVVKIIDLIYARTGLDVASAEKARMGVLKETVIHTSRAGYYPGASPLTVTVIFEEKGGRIVGAQMAGRDVVAKRIDVFATAISAGMTVVDVAGLDLAYAPPFGPVYDPVILSCQVAMRKIQA